ncbi:MAG: hypothetical protein AB1515_09495, partial [Nitrospirota bacterium]
MFSGSITQAVRALMDVTVNRELLLEFFLTFARFEFALKQAGFLKQSSRERPDAKPDWDSFAQELRGVFQSSGNPQLLQACDHLLLNPPWREVVINGATGWDSSAEDDQLSEVEQLLRYVRRVRNNLFHGGKFTSSPMPDLGRN